MTNTTYNGWTNRETWLVNLHFSELFELELKESPILDEYNNMEISLFDLSDHMKESFEIVLEEELENLSPFISDYLDLSLICWDELVKNWIEE